MARDLIFLSYRRTDASAEALTLHADLSEVFGPDRVFANTGDLQDTDPPYVEERLERAAVLIVVVGPSWVRAADEHGNRRLDDDDDRVRREVAAGLSAPDCSVIQVMVRGAVAPPAGARLHESIAHVGLRPKVELRQGYWKRNFAELCTEIVAATGWERIGTAKASGVADEPLIGETFKMTDDGQKVVVSSRPLAPLILALIWLVAGIALLVAVIAIGNHERTEEVVRLPGLWSGEPGTVTERPFTSHDNYDENFTFFIFLTMGTFCLAAFEAWRTRRFYVVFDRTARQVHIRRSWPIGRGDEQTIDFDRLTDVLLGGQFVSSRPPFASGTIELQTASEQLRCTGWIPLREVNRIQIKILSLLGT